MNGLKKKQSELRDALIVAQWVRQGCNNAALATRTISPHLTYGSSRETARRIFARIDRNPDIVAQLGHILSADEVKQGLSRLATEGKSEQTQLGAYNTLARVHALLIDKTDNINRNMSLDEDGLRAKAAEEAIKMLAEAETSKDAITASL